MSLKYCIYIYCILTDVLSNLTNGWNFHSMFAWKCLIHVTDCVLWHPIAFRRTIQTAYKSKLRPKQNGRYIPDDIFKWISFNENKKTIKISLQFVPKHPINNISALVQTVAWRRLGEKPLSEPTMVSLLKHICVTRPQWVDTWLHFNTIQYKQWNAQI